MKKLIFVFLVAPSLGFAFTNDPCDAGAAILSLVPGAQFSITNTADLNTVIWLSTMTQPTALQIQNQISSCQASLPTTQAQTLAWQTELSTTTTAVAAFGTNYVGSSAVQQIQINQKMARIIQLKQLLGIQ